MPLTSSDTSLSSGRLLGHGGKYWCTKIQSFTRKLQSYYGQQYVQLLPWSTRLPLSVLSRCVPDTPGCLVSCLAGKIGDPYAAQAALNAFHQGPCPWCGSHFNTQHTKTMRTRAGAPFTIYLWPGHSSVKPAFSLPVHEEKDTTVSEDSLVPSPAFLISAAFALWVQMLTQ